MAARRDRYRQSVFINCPFDNQYWPLFEALVFTVIACEFEPRCALEELAIEFLEAHGIAYHREPRQE